MTLAQLVTLDAVDLVLAQLVAADAFVLTRQVVVVVVAAAAAAALARQVALAAPALPLLVAAVLALARLVAAVVTAAVGWQNTPTAFDGRRLEARQTRPKNELEFGFDNTITILYFSNVPVLLPCRQSPPTSCSPPPRERPP